jgi:hypothetical protein
MVEPTSCACHPIPMVPCIMCMTPHSDGALHHVHATTFRWWVAFESIRTSGNGTALLQHSFTPRRTAPPAFVTQNRRLHRRLHHSSACFRDSPERLHQLPSLARLAPAVLTTLHQLCYLCRLAPAVLTAPHCIGCGAIFLPPLSVGSGKRVLDGKNELHEVVLVRWKTPLNSRHVKFLSKVCAKV